MPDLRDDLIDPQAEVNRRRDLYRNDPVAFSQHALGMSGVLWADRPIARAFMFGTRLVEAILWPTVGRVKMPVKLTVHRISLIARVHGGRPDGKIRLLRLRRYWKRMVREGRMS